MTDADGQTPAASMIPCNSKPSRSEPSSGHVVGGACGRPGSRCLLILLIEVLRDGLIEGTEKALQGADGDAGLAEQPADHGDWRAGGFELSREGVPQAVLVDPASDAGLGCEAAQQAADVVIG